MPASPVECSVESFVAALRSVSGARRFLVAYSGGLDSHTLLHLLVMLREKQAIDVGAVHVDHGLHVQAPQWSAHCEAVCAGLTVPLQVLRVDARPRSGESPEAGARRARYDACARALREDQELVTAHTADDQAETLLLRLLRGSGIDGAVGIRARRSLGEHWVIRPLLGFRKAALRDYAHRARLQWIEDPSNRELRYDRNFVRQRVLPLLQQRWPAATAILARDAANFAETAVVLEALAREDLATAGGARAECLSVSALLRLTRPRRAMALRLWLRETAAVATSTAQLKQLLDSLAARPDRNPRVRFGDVEARRYRDELLLVRDTDNAPLTTLPWSMRTPLQLPHRETPLTAEELTRMGLVIPEGAVVEIRYRQGGERIKLAGHTHHKALKKLFQERAVPPWRRDRIPLLYVNGQLAAVLGMGVAAAFCATGEVCENPGEKTS